MHSKRQSQQGRNNPRRATGVVFVVLPVQHRPQASLLCLGRCMYSRELLAYKLAILTIQDKFPQPHRAGEARDVGADDDMFIR